MTVIYNFLYWLGDIVIKFFQNNIHGDLFLASLPHLLQGMVGIFVVMAVIFLAIWGLQKLSK